MTEEIVKNHEELGSKLWDLRNQELCCDTILIINGKSVHAHGAVLASSNEFFKNSLCNENISSNGITFNDVNEETLLSVIEYFYKGFIKLTEKNAMDVLKIAKKLNISFLIEKCSKYMAKILNIDNVISLLKLAKEANMETLKSVVLSFIEKNSYEIFHTAEFLTLDYSDLKEILDSKMKYVSEMRVYEAMKRWIKHDTSRNDNLIDLLNRVKLECLPMDFLLSESYSMCDMNANCMRIFLKAIATQRSNSSSDCLDSKNTLIVLSGQYPEMSNYMEIFDIDRNTWSDIYHDFKRTYFTAVLLNEKLMIIGGLINGVATNSIEYYDIETGQVENMPSMKYIRHQSSAVILNDEVYVIGGGVELESCTGIPHVEKWSTTSKIWKEMAPMNIPRYSHATMILGEKIYVIGGCANVDYNETVEFYNPTENTWKMCKSMHKKRYYPASAVLDGLIYVVGGYNNSDSYLNSAEKYDPVADTWTMIQSIGVPRDRLAGGVLNGQLVITGGRNYSLGNTIVEAYDAKNNKWKPMAQLNRVRNDHHVIEVPWKLARFMLNKN